VSHDVHIFRDPSNGHASSGTNYAQEGKPVEARAKGLGDDIAINHL
jgi:hypothetical protein